MDRDDHLQRAIDRGEVWDVIIIGGGASGLGTALDATTRGLKVLLLESSDFGKGTSSRSTKLIHGGVRYLQQGNIALVRESLAERTRLLHNAPHLVHPLEFLLPCRSWIETAYYGTGMKMYDLLAGSPQFPRSRIIGRDSIQSKAPQLNPKAYRSAIAYYDGQFDDSRLIVSLLRTAASAEATLVNGAKVTSLLHGSTGRLQGVEFVDVETQNLHAVQGRCIVNTTGPFSDSIRRLDQPNTTPILATSQGIHLVLPAECFSGNTAVIVPKTTDGRVVFIIPWHNHVLLGTTDTPIEQPQLEPRPLDQEIDFLLETAAGYFARPPRREDCLSVFTGIRPLVMSKSSASTSQLSRDHFIDISASGLITMTGGKWTTYRKMAEDCVNRIGDLLSTRLRPCATHDMRLQGWCEAPMLARAKAHEVVYGSEFEQLNLWCRENPDWSRRLHSKLPYRVVDVIWAVRREWARTIDDVLARRLRALFLNANAALACAPQVADIIANELGRSDTWKQAELTSFREIANGFIVS